MAKKRRKKASKKTGSAKTKLGQVIKTLHAIKKHV